MSAPSTSPSAEPNTNDAVAQLEATVTVLLRKNAELEARLSMERQHHESAEARLISRQLYVLTRVLRSHRIFLVHAGAPGDFSSAISQLQNQLREDGAVQIVEHVRPLADVVSEAAGVRVADERRFATASIEQLELEVIRSMALLGEELCRRADLIGSQLGENFRVSLVGRLFDNIEHSAQYALEGSSVAFRASVVMSDIADMVHMLRERAGRPSFGTVPSPSDLQSLYAECERRGGLLQRREAPEFSGWGATEVADASVDAQPAERVAQRTFLGMPLLPKKLARMIGKSNLRSSRSTSLRD